MKSHKNKMAPAFLPGPCDALRPLDCLGGVAALTCLVVYAWRHGDHELAWVMGLTTLWCAFGALMS